MNKIKSTVALVLAGGHGTRLGSTIPKQYHRLAGKAVMRWSLETLCQHEKIDYVRAVINDDDEGMYDLAVNGIKLLDPVFGGKTRQESARKGIESFKEINPARILIHDGARPFIDKSLIDRLLSQLEDDVAVIPVVKVTDTLKESDGEWVEKTLDSSKLWGAQTPQAFIFDKIYYAHQKASHLNLTDDASIAEYAGIKVRLIEGLKENIKITFRNDMDRALQMISRSTENIRVGTGFDVHRFGEGNHITLCGLDIPFSRGIVGYSDGDVAIHALVDALLGAIAEGDIGTHFPSDTKEWENKNSSYFLSYALGLLNEHRASINNVDLTLICNAPNISQFRDCMRENLAKIMGVPFQKISIKGTTSDGLGFTGRGEGIAAQATVTLVFYAD